MDITSKSRNSAIEILRILCIVGIICMHIYGHVTNGVLDLAYYALVNTVFNCGVSLFVLISGFYGIRPTISGGVRIVFVTTFYSLLTYFLRVCGGGIVLKELIRAMLPVYAGKYWFISAYFVLYCFSDLINKAIDLMNKKQHLLLIMRFFILFVLVPTITFLHIMGDGGKGLCNMLLMYLIGRYIRKYYGDLRQRSYILYAVILLACGVSLNFITGYFVPREGVPYVPLAKDSSIITVALSVLIFLEVIRHEFVSKFINRVATHVIAIYLFEGALEGVFLKATGLWDFKGNWYYLFMLFLCAIGIGFCCCIIDEVQCILFIPIQKFIRVRESQIVGKIQKMWNEMQIIKEKMR